jgi:hypothetical protein
MATLSSFTLSPEFSNSKIVCNKEDVVLLRDECRENGNNNNNNNNNNNKYRIIFNAHNSNFPIHSIVGLKLYTLLYELNRDIIHIFKIVNETETSVETVTLFKPFGKDFGIAPKAMHTVSTMHLEPSVCTFDSVDVQPQPHDAIGVNHIPRKYERIQSTHSKLIVYFLSANDLQFDFTFELSDDDDDGDKNDDQEEESSSCPIYMENSVALMIKKMFCRLKGFTERMA